MGNDFRRRVVTADEYDAYTKWRSFLIWHAGDVKAIKRRTHRRERREARRLIRDVPSSPE